MKAAVSVACHFDTFKALEHISSYFYGIYDFGLGQICKFGSRDFIKQYDEASLAAKCSSYEYKLAYEEV